MEDINYIKHLNAVFVHIIKDSRLNPTHISLYFGLFYLWNTNFFRDEFYINRDDVMKLSKIGSRTTYHRCIKELGHWSYFEYLPSHNSFHGSKIRMFNFCTSDGQDSLEHQLFFASHPIQNDNLNSQKTDTFIYVRVDGTQTVKANYRLQMRLTRDAYINNVLVPKNAPIYGFVSFKPNRTVINIENVNHQPVKLKAFDLQDGSEGIYVENSFRAEATNEVLGDMVDDINITGVPQVSGIRKIFQRNHRNVKVTITDNYKLILRTPKPSLNQIFGKPKY